MFIDINIPDIGADEVEVTEVLVSVGDKVEVEQSLITVEGDKVSMEVPSPFPGTVKLIKINVGDKVSTGSSIMVFEVEGDLSEPVSGTSQKITVVAPLQIASQDEFAEDDAYVHATPLIRRLAREFGVNLADRKSVV